MNIWHFIYYLLLTRPKFRYLWRITSSQLTAPWGALKRHSQIKPYFWPIFRFDCRKRAHPAATATDVLLPPPPPESVQTSSALPVLPVLPALPLPLLHFIDFGWVNMFSKQMGVQLSAHRPGLHVVDYYNEVYLDGDAIADFMWRSFISIWGVILNWC